MGGAYGVNTSLGLKKVTIEELDHRHKGRETDHKIVQEDGPCSSHNAAFTTLDIIFVTPAPSKRHRYTEFSCTTLQRTSLSSILSYNPQTLFLLKPI